MKNKNYRTRYFSIVHKGSVGKCVDVVNSYVHALRLEFKNGESFWFMMRDLKEVQDDAEV